jgi:hypothetical protein
MCFFILYSYITRQLRPVNEVSTGHISEGHISITLKIQVADYYENETTKWVSALTHMNLIIYMFLIFPNREFLAVSSFKYHTSEDPCRL